MNSIKENYKKEILYCIVAGFISLSAVYIFHGLRNVDLNVPFKDINGDVFGALNTARNFITGNGRYLYPDMGAPGVVTTANWPESSTIHYFGMWILSFFIKEPGLLVNIFYILTYIFISISATISLRLLNINPMTSILGGVLYSLSPYHFFRGTQQIFLSAYAIIPFACVLLLWIINGEIYFNKIKPTNDTFYKNIFSVFNCKINISIIIAIFIGMDLSYYIFFSCLCISFAIIWNFLQERNFRKTFSSSVILLTVIISTLVNLIPYIITIFNGIESGLTGTRTVKDVEASSLNFSQLILPVYNHRFSLFNKIRKYYDNNISLTHLAGGYPLGLFFSIGLTASLFIAMVRSGVNSKNIQEEANIQHSAVLNVFMIVLGSIGGISSLIAFVIPNLRSYSRLSIFIAFYSAYIVVYYIDSFLTKRKTKKIIKAATIAFLGIIFAFEQVSGNNKLSNKNNEKYYSDKDFIKQVEEITPAGSMVFQLPFVRSDNYGDFKGIGMYEQFVPFVHSKTLKWSYRAMLNSSAERWQRAIASYAVDGTETNSVDRMLRHLAGIGFAGIYMDKNGYNDYEYNKIRNSITGITGVKPVISRNERLEYFYLGKYLEKIKKEFNDKERKIYENLDVKIINFSIYDLKYINADVIENKAIIYKDGIQYGPYTELKKGHYSVLIKGNNLSQAIADVCHNYGQELIKNTEKTHNDYEISYAFFIKENLNNVEFRMVNKTETDVILFGYEIEKTD
jgi:phosphoglycerol transferase